MKTAVALRHIAFEDLGLIEPWLKRRGWRVVTYDAGVDELWKIDLGQVDLLVVLGGPIGAYDDFMHEAAPRVEDAGRLEGGQARGFDKQQPGTLAVEQRLHLLNQRGAETAAEPIGAQPQYQQVLHSRRHWIRRAASG